jgi:hypothetical protein
MRYPWYIQEQKRQTEVAYDELPGVGVSRLRASGAIKPEDKTTIIKFWLLNKETPPAGAYEEVEFTVGVALHRFPGGGSWSFFVCPCGCRCRTIRLYEGKLACRRCLQKRGLRSRIHMIPASERYYYTGPKRRAKLNSRECARLHPRWPTQTMERRKRMQRALDRSRLVALQAEIKQFQKEFPGEIP